MALPLRKWYVGSTKWTAVAAWAALTSYPAGTLIRQNATPTVGNERVFVQLLTTAPTSAASEPTWTVTQGAKTTDATCTWIEITGQAGVNGDLTNCPNWTAIKGLAIPQGYVIQRNSGASLQVCTTAGTAGSGAEPSFSNTAGTTTADNTATWTSLGVVGNFAAWAAPHARLWPFLVSTVWSSTDDTVFVSSNHSVTTGNTSSTNYGSPALRTVFLSVNDTAAPPTTLLAGATEAYSANGGFQSVTIGSNYSYFNGITFQSNNVSTAQNFFTLGMLSSFYENCTFQINMGTSSTNCAIQFGQVGTAQNGLGNGNYFDIRNCTFLFSKTDQQVGLFGLTIANMKNISIAPTGVIPTSLFSLTTAAVTIADSDLSNLNITLFNLGNNYAGITTLSNCKLNSGVSLTTGNYTSGSFGFLKLHNSDSANTNYRYYYNTYAGIAQQETTVVRTGGATNGTTAISWNITTNSTISFSTPFVSEDISVWNTNASGSQTATIYITSNTVLTNATFWAEAEYLGTSSFPLGNLISSKMAWFGTPTALTTDSSTWGGSISNKYKIVLNFTPTQVGALKVRFYCAAPSATIYVDPEIVISNQTSGRQYIIPGGTFHNDASSSGGSSSMLVHPGLIGGMHG